MNLIANHLSDSQLTIGTVEHLGRFPPLKRLLARLLLPFFGYQIYLNRSFTEDLVRVEQALGALERSLALVRQSVEEVTSRWERLDGKIDLVQRSVEAAASRWELLDSKIDLVQCQSFAMGMH